MILYKVYNAICLLMVIAIQVESGFLLLMHDLTSPVMYRDDSVTFDLYCMRTLTFDSSSLYFDPMYENVVHSL